MRTLRFMPDGAVYVEEEDSTLYAILWLGVDKKPFVTKAIDDATGGIFPHSCVACVLLECDKEELFDGLVVNNEFCAELRNRNYFKGML